MEAHSKDEIFNEIFKDKMIDRSKSIILEIVNMIFLNTKYWY